ncbi:MAG TPA: hypothetical protein VM118_13740, partial [Acidobacteriota bacterium]|nr:hypothetical protein [Acidobacteriota bacterium]
YPHIDVDGDNLAHVSIHQRIETGFQYTAWHLLLPIEGSSLHLDKNLGMGIGEIQGLWTDVAIEQNGGVKDASTDIWHIVSLGGEDAGGGLATPSNRIWYWRYDDGAAVPAWEGPVLVDSSTTLGYTLDADDNSDNVALAFHSNYTTDGFNGLNNIAYRESQTSGAGWITGVELGPSNKNFVTSYSVASGPQAWTETSVAYDLSGDLHILFTEQRIANVSEHLALRHWSKSRGTVRPVAIAYYDNDGTWLRTLNIGHISIGVGDGTSQCKGGAETNENYLYAMFSKLGGETSAEEDDMSQLGFDNSELWLTASNSGGFTWAPPINLTNTKTPECTSRNPDSVCASEAWGTIARDVSDIEILYIQDFEAGSFSDAPWAVGRVMYLNFPGGGVNADYICPIIAPNFASFITYEPECEYHADPGGVNLETLTILNVGNDYMEGNVSVTAGDPWLTVSLPGDYTIPAGGDDIVMDVTMSAVGLAEDLYVGEIQITHNDTSKVSPRSFPIEFFVVTDFKCPQDEVLKTAVASPGVLSLEVLSNARFGAQSDEGTLWRFVDSSSTVFDASLLLAHGTQDPDTIVYHRFFDGNDPGQYGWRALTDLKIDTMAYGTGNGFAKASAYMTTADSVTKVRVEWFFPQNPVYGDFVIAKYKVSNRLATPIDDVLVGIWTDLDVTCASRLANIQDGVGNHGNYVQAQNLIYQYGYDTVGHVPANHLNSTERYSGGISYLAGRDATGAAFKLVQAPLRGGVGDNRDNTLAGRPNSPLFYRTLVGGPGVSVWEPSPHADSAKDCYTWITLDQGRTLAASGASPEVYIVALLSDTLQHDAYSMTPKLAGGLAEVVDSAWSWADWNGKYVFCKCACHADPQCDGVTNVLDVVQTVNVAFRGGSPVFDDDCPYERTDVDCSGYTNVLDVVKIVNVAFRGGLPESQFCDGCQ